MINKKFKKNMIFSVITIVMSILQTLFMVPYITNAVSAEAYGYVSVVMNIVNMATIVSIAITSMSARYITIELQKKDFDKANSYFNSILVALIFISFGIILLSTVAISNINYFMNISSGFVVQVKILFAVAMTSLVISLIISPFLSGLYYKNSLFIMYIFASLNYLLKIGFTIVLFNNYKLVIWGPFIGGLIIDFCSLIFYIFYIRYNVPQISISISKFKKKNILDVLSSGIWISITKLGTILLSTCSIYLSNILVDVKITGIYAAIIQLQSLAILVTGAIVTCFNPEMYKLYANNEKDKLIEYTKMSIRILDIPIGIIVGGIIIFGKYFMSLWINNQYMNYGMLITLSVIGLSFSLPIDVLSNLNVTVNKVKLPAIVSIISGILNVTLTIILCKSFNMGIYGIAVSQVAISILRALIFFPMYSAHILSISKKTFYPDILYCTVVTLITILFGIIANRILVPTSWLTLIACILFTGVCSFIIILLINKKMRYKIKIMFLKYLRIKNLN